MKVCFILETRQPLRPNPIIVEAAARLEDRGAKVRFVYPEQEVWRLDTLKVEADLYLLKSDSELALSLAHSLELVGARVLNSYDACRLAKDKTVAAGLLSGAEIPTPASHAAGCPSQLAGLLGDGPIILKPNRGYHGVGLATIEDADALRRAPDYNGTVFSHRYLADARKDLKLYGIGEDVFAVRKEFSADSFKRDGEAAALEPVYEDIARRCAKAFGLSLYGIDIAETGEGPCVVDVNYFPGYRGVEGAAHRLSDYIWAHGRSAN